jgi:hypothetical protein
VGPHAAGQPQRLVGQLAAARPGRSVGEQLVGQPGQHPRAGAVVAGPTGGGLQQADQVNIQIEELRA